MNPLLKLAQSISRLAAKEPECCRIIRDVFKNTGRTLRRQGEDGNADCTYLCSQTDDTWQFELVRCEQEDYTILQSTPSNLLDFGYAARPTGQGKLAIEKLPNEVDKHYDEVVSILGAKGPGNRCVRMRGNDYVFDYCPKGTLTVSCSKGPIKTARTYKVDRPSAKAFADAISYQSDRYEAMFNGSTYEADFLCDPLKLKKHAIYYLGEHQNVVTSPDDTVTLLSADGERSLERPEGVIARDVRKSFRSVKQAMRAQPNKGDIYNGFAHLLKKRGLLP